MMPRKQSLKDFVVVYQGMTRCAGFPTVVVTINGKPLKGGELVIKEIVPAPAPQPVNEKGA